MDEFEHGVAVKKGSKDAVVGGLALWAGTAIATAVGGPVVVIVPLVAGVLGYTRNVLKKKLPKAFGWL